MADVSAQRGRRPGRRRPAAGGPASSDPRTMPLWDGPAPGALGTADADVPTLTYYPAYGRTSRRPAIIVAPGGGYQNLAMNHEGRQVANWFNAQGVAAFVLKYRLGPTYHHPVEMGDAQRAMRTRPVRGPPNSAFAPDRIGFMGFSAGGHLASTVGTHFDTGDAVGRRSDRSGQQPARLSDPRLSRGDVGRARTRTRARSGICSATRPIPALLENLSNEKQVTKDTPPTFLFHTNADTTVPAENSVYFYLALRKAGVPAELHIFEPGSHGVGLALDDPVLSGMAAAAVDWLRHRGLLTPPAGA